MGLELRFASFQEPGRVGFKEKAKPADIKPCTGGTARPHLL